MCRFRVVLFRNPASLETQFTEKVDFEKIEETLRTESVVGVFIGKEKE